MVLPLRSLTFTTCAMLTSLAVQPSLQLADVQVEELPCEMFHSFCMQFCVCAYAAAAKSIAPDSKTNRLMLHIFTSSKFRLNVKVRRESFPLTPGIPPPVHRRGDLCSRL